EIVNLPDIGEGITEGEMVKWLVQVGDAVEIDQPIAEVMTDKATVEVPATTNGVVKELKVQEGDMIPIESEMLILETSGASAPAAAKVEKVEVKTEAQAPQKNFAGATTSPTPGVQPPLPSFDVLATPSTRRLAREMNVDINQIKGTGLAGRVTREDILGAKGNHITTDPP
ncbi:E3 binding domain-containing protein, partial [bacterium]|nr:E3 binding domain-containing protein [bacterium]